MYSIVIPTYGIKGIHMVESLIDSISSFNNPNLNEIIISDDGTTSDTIEQLKQLEYRHSNGPFNIIIVFNPLYHSFSKTVNNGIRVSNPKDDILLLNNDMTALTSFEPFVDFALQNTKVGIVGAKLLYKNLTIQHAGLVRMSLLNFFRHVYRFKNYNYEPTNIPRKYIAVTGACQYLKRNLINTIGYFDENYKLSFEDVDYCVNAQSHGYEVWYIPDVIMIHYESATRKNSNDLANRAKFWNKWKYAYEKIRIDNQIPDDNLDINVAKASLATLFTYSLIK